MLFNFFGQVLIRAGLLHLFGHQSFGDPENNRQQKQSTFCVLARTRLFDVFGLLN